VENAELKQRLLDYQQDFKKQQDYLVAIETKLRKNEAEEKEA
jgi:hypothetical protein